jgi:hypothetical protein
MDGFWGLIAVLGVWYVLQAWVFPRLGVPT